MASERERIHFNLKGPIPVVGVGRGESGGHSGGSLGRSPTGTQTQTPAVVLPESTGTAVLDLTFQYPCQVYPAAPPSILYFNSVHSLTFHSHPHYFLPRSTPKEFLLSIPSLIWTWKLSPIVCLSPPPLPSMDQKLGKRSAAHHIKIVDFRSWGWFCLSISSSAIPFPYSSILPPYPIYLFPISPPPCGQVRGWGIGLTRAHMIPYFRSGNSHFGITIRLGLVCWLSGAPTPNSTSIRWGETMRFVHQGNTIRFRACLIWRLPSPSQVRTSGLEWVRWWWRRKGRFGWNGTLNWQPGLNFSTTPGEGEGMFSEEKALFSILCSFALCLGERLGNLFHVPPQN